MLDENLYVLRDSAARAKALDYPFTGNATLVLLLRNHADTALFVSASVTSGGGSA